MAIQQNQFFDNLPQLKKQLRLIEEDHLTYIPFEDYTGCGVRTKLFEYANAPAVLCMDCHVFLAPGALKRLIDYYDENPETEDLLHGPFLKNAIVIKKHFNFKRNFRN